MNRPLFAWSIYGICLVLTFAAVTWLTRSAWHSDQARQQALLDSEIQNALWQMDSLVAPLLAIEINRPSLSGSFSNSPMLDPKLIRGYVVYDASGLWTMRRDGRATLRQELPPDCPLITVDWSARLHSKRNNSTDLAVTDSDGATLSAYQFIQPVGGQGGGQAGGQAGGQYGGFGGGQMGQMSSGRPNQQLDQSQAGQSGQIRSQSVLQMQMAVANSLNPSQESKTTFEGFVPLQPVWVNGDLVFARQTAAPKNSNKKIIEICWLNWKEWEALLTDQLREFSIPLVMKPCGDTTDRTDWQPNSRQMVSLPIRLEPKFKHVPGPWPRPLIAVWILLVLVAIAFAWLLRQTLNLSERRAAFVSAVTHELRTPLTTFRLYTEMLSDGLATDPEQQQLYYQTLNREANRLTHLVENVLAFARLEHGRITARNETLTLGELIDRCQSRLEQRVADTPLSLTTSISDFTRATQLTTNAMAVEQILFNLIDNACKYASGATDPRIVIEARAERKDICVQISDFGPGLSAAARRKLTQPFQKSASQAAESAPGIGLGLALSHRLARDLEGSLRCYPNTPTGLCVELRLPRAITRN